MAFLPPIRLRTVAPLLLGAFLLFPSRGAAWTEGAVTLRALASDNLDRLPPGEEREGVLWTAGGAFTLGRGTGEGAPRLKVAAGEEWVGGAEEDADLVYQLEGIAPWRLGGGTSLTARILARRATVAAGEEDSAEAAPVDRTRLWTETMRGEASLRTGKPGSPNGVITLAMEETERSFPSAPPLTSRRASLGGSLLLPGPRDEWKMEASVTQGETRDQDLEWGLTGAEATWSRSVSPVAKAGVTLAGSWSRTEESGVRSGSRSVAAFLSGSRRPSPGLTLKGRVGAERFDGTGDHPVVEAAGEATIEAAISRGLSLAASASSRVEDRGGDGEAALLARSASIRASLSLQAGETVSLALGSRLWNDTYAPGDGGAAAGEERTDEGGTLTAQATWKPARRLTLSAQAAWERVTSSLPEAELREGRLSLRAEAGF